MKITCVIILSLILSTNEWTQGKAVNGTDWPLYRYDQKRCIFEAKIGVWGKHNGKDVLPVITKLTNTSDDTLKYEMMTYRMVAYDIKCDALIYENAGEDINKNIPEIDIIPPHQSQTFVFNLVKKNDVKELYGDLEVGFCLVLPKYNTTRHYLIEDPFGYRLTGDGKTIPHTKELTERTHWLWSGKIKFSDSSVPTE